MHMLIDLSKRLIGEKPRAGATVGDAQEHVPVDNIRKKRVASPLTFDDYGENITRDSPGADPNDFLLPADHQCFPAGRRLLQSMVDAQMTSKDGKSHLFAFGEFAAMYLSVWSNAVWTPLRDPARPEVLDLPTPEDVIEKYVWPDILSTYVGCPIDIKESRDADLPTDSEAIKEQKKLRLSATLNISTTTIRDPATTRTKRARRSRLSSTSSCTSRSSSASCRTSGPASLASTTGSRKCGARWRTSRRT